MTMVRVALAVWMLVWLLAPVRATTLERLSLDDMILKSTAIVRGRIVSSQASFHKTLIYTHYKIQVLERWKGSGDSVEEVVVPGGTAQGLRQSYAGTPRMTEGGEYLFFLWKGTSGLTHVIGLSQGAMRLSKDSKGNVVVGRAAISETMLDPKTGTPVGDSPVSLSLKEMSDRIRRTLAQGGNR